MLTEANYLNPTSLSLPLSVLPTHANTHVIYSYHPLFLAAPFNCMLLLYSHVPYHNDTIIKTDAVINDAGRKTSLAIFTSHLICKVRKVFWGFTVRGSKRPTINCNILTPKFWPSALCLSRSPGLLNRRPWCWLSLLHLIRIFSGPQFIRAPSPFGPV